MENIYVLMIFAMIVGFVVYMINQGKQQKNLMYKQFQDRQAAKNKFKELFNGLSTEGISERIDTFIASRDFGESEKYRMLNEMVKGELDKMLDDGLLSRDEEVELNAFMSHFDTSFWRRDLLEKIYQAKILRSILNGEDIPEADVETSILFARNERPLYAFENISFLQERVKSSFVGGGAGVSFRVAKGVYLRTGAFKGQPIKTAEIQNIDEGELVITSQNIYFRGNVKSFKIELKKIINIEAFSDGIKIEKEGVSFKPYYFKGMDVWFCSNLINHLASESR